MNISQKSTNVFSDPTELIGVSAEASREMVLGTLLIAFLSSVDPTVGSRGSSVLREMHTNFSMSFTRAVVAISVFENVFCFLSWHFPCINL